MNIKKYLLAEIDDKNAADIRAQQIQKLKLSSLVGCFQGYGITTMTNPVNPIGVNEQPYLSAKVGEEEFKIIANPDEIINVTQQNKPANQRTKSIKTEWPECDNYKELEEYLKVLYSRGWTFHRPTQAEIDDGEYITFDLKNGTPRNSTELVTNKDPNWKNGYDVAEKYYQYLKNTLTGPLYISKRIGKVKDATSREYTENECFTALQNHVTFFLQEVGYDEQQFKVNKDTLQQCIRRGLPVSGRINVGNRAGAFGLPKNEKNGDVEKIKTFFYNLPYPERDAKKGPFKLEQPRGITETKILKKVKNKLVEIHNQKKQKITELNLVKNRLDFIIENVEKFKTFNTPKKVGLGFRYLKEMSKLKQIGLLNEELGNLFQQIFGKSLDSILTNVSEPLLTSIFDKMDLPEDLKMDVVQRIHSKTTELLASMDNCENLTNFLSSELSESLADHILSSQKIGSELLDSSLSELVKGEEFKKNISAKLNENICALFEKFSENAKNLVTKLSEV